jgi:hypothetical protein
LLLCGGYRPSQGADFAGAKLDEPDPLPMVTTLSIVPKSRFHKFVSTLFIVFLLVFSNHGLTHESEI